MTIHTLSLLVPAMQQKAIRAFAQMKTLAQIDQVFELVSNILALSPEHELDPVTAALYETTLERRAELLKAREERTPPPRSYFPERKKSAKNRSEAAAGRRDPERWARKRRLGGMAGLPPHIREMFSEGERAVLYIVADDVYRRGSCSCSNKEIGDRAGVGLTTVRNTLRKARQMNLIRVQHREQWRGKNLTNIVTLLCKRWRSAFLRFRPRLGGRSSGDCGSNVDRKGVKKTASSETLNKIIQKGQPNLYPFASPSGGVPPFARRKPSYG